MNIVKLFWYNEHLLSSCNISNNNTHQFTGYYFRGFCLWLLAFFFLLISTGAK